MNIFQSYSKSNFKGESELQFFSEPLREDVYLNEKRNEIFLLFLLFNFSFSF